MLVCHVILGSCDAGGRVWARVKPVVRTAHTCMCIASPQSDRGQIQSVCFEYGRDREARPSRKLPGFRASRHPRSNMHAPGIYRRN
eukprot:3881398-Prymnesium_polylepis.1